MGKDWSGFKGGIQYCPTSGKVMYDKRGAVTAANHRYSESHQKLRIYPCPQCGSWHLTKILNGKRYQS